MPNVYHRQGGSNRATWTSQQLRDALKVVQDKTTEVNVAARQFGIPKSSLKERIRKNDDKKTSRLGLQ